MFFELGRAAGRSSPSSGPRSALALESLLPGPVTILLANPPGRFGPACGPDPGTLGLRVPLLAAAARGARAARRAR